MGKNKRPQIPSKRNPLHDHPLLRKGGSHTKSNKSARRKDRVVLRKEWLRVCA